MAKKKEDFVLSPLKDGNQKYAIRSNADVVVLTGGTGSGKTLALYYAPIQYLYENENAKIVCFMRNISDFWGAGKVNDSLKKMYPLIDRTTKRQPHDPIGEIVRNEKDMGMRLFNGSEIKFQQLDNENPIVIDKIAKGLQAKKLIFDECNKFEWRTITSFMPRLRSDSTGKAQIFLAQNPERECFLRKLCGKGEHGGGWINDDGTVDKSMDGVVMYFNMQEGDLDKTYFGRTKLEVYEKCREHIDALVAHDPDMSYEDFILSMVFYTFDVRDNKAMLAKNKKYRGFSANSATAQSAYAANWNYSLKDEEVEDTFVENAQIQPSDVELMFHSINLPSGSQLLKRFMTVDMATTGSDNLVMKYWELWSNYGYVCRDIFYCVKNTNRDAVIMIYNFRDKHGLSNKEIILDVQGFGFLRECFEGQAIFFSGAGKASARSRMLFRSMKDEAAHLAMEMVTARLIHYEPSLANMPYKHQKAKHDTGLTVQRQMKAESVVFQFYKTPSTKIAMMDKEKQHSLLKGMSPDLFDNIVILCGGTYHTCYNMLREDAGVMRKRMQTSDMFAALNINLSEDVQQPFMPQRKPITNSSRILNILSTI